MTRLPRSASVLHAAGRFASKNCPSSMPDHLGVVGDLLHQLVRVAHVLRRDPHVAVRHDVVFAEAVVDERLEDLHLLPRDLRPAQPADQLLALAAEHAAGDDFDPAVVGRLADDFHRDSYSIRRGGRRNSAAVTVRRGGGRPAAADLRSTGRGRSGRCGTTRQTLGSSVLPERDPDSNRPAGRIADRSAPRRGTAPALRRGA